MLRIYNEICFDHMVVVKFVSIFCCLVKYTFFMPQISPAKKEERGGQSGCSSLDPRGQAVGQRGLCQHSKSDVSELKATSLIPKATFPACGDATDGRIRSNVLKGDLCLVFVGRPTPIARHKIRAC